MMGDTDKNWWRRYTLTVFGQEGCTPEIDTNVVTCKPSGSEPEEPEEEEPSDLVTNTAEDARMTATIKTLDFVDTVMFKNQRPRPGVAR
jgi:hypothetical protein